MATIKPKLKIVDSLSKGNENLSEKDKLAREQQEREAIMRQEGEYEYLYPSLDDPEFNVKIAKRKEFYLKGNIKDKCNSN